MEVKAISRFVRIGPRKVRMVLETVVGLPVGTALNQLKFMPHHGARVLERTIQSAVANAVDRQVGDVDDLVIKRAWVDQGPSFKRIHAAPQGRAARILKRTSHVTVVVAAASGI